MISLNAEKGGAVIKIASYFLVATNSSTFFNAILAHEILLSGIKKVCDNLLKIFLTNSLGYLIVPNFFNIEFGSNPSTLTISISLSVNSLNRVLSCAKYPVFPVVTTVGFQLYSGIYLTNFKVL